MINPDVVTVTAAVDAAVKRANDPEIAALANQAMPIAERMGVAEVTDFFNNRVEGPPYLPQPDITFADGSLKNDILIPALERLRDQETALPIVERKRYLQARDALLTIQAQTPGKGIVTVDLDLLKSTEGEQVAVGEVRQDTDFIRKVNNRWVAVLTNKFVIPHATLEQAKPLLDPMNWDNVTTFFRQMTAQEPPKGSDGWDRVLETVGTKQFQISNALKCWKGEAGSGDNEIAFVNYDLDDENRRKGDDGWVVVDNGYLTARTVEGKVTVHVSKELLIRGLSPIATAVLARSIGWEKVAFDVFDDDPIPPDLKPWEVSKKPDGYVAEIKDVPRKTAKFLPRRTRDAVIGETRAQVDSVLEKTAKLVDDAATRWHNGLTENDIFELTRRAHEFANKFTTDTFDIPKRLFLADKQEAAR